VSRGGLAVASAALAVTVLSLGDRDVSTLSAPPGEPKRGTALVLGGTHADEPAREPGDVTSDRRPAGP